MKNSFKNRLAITLSLGAAMLFVTMLPLYACHTVTLSLSPSGISRDKSHTTTATGTLKFSTGDKLPDAGKTMTFTLTGPGEFVGASSGTTDANGNFAVTIRSNDIGNNNKDVTITASAEGESDTKTLTLYGITISWNDTPWSKLYISSTYNYEQTEVIKCVDSNGGIPSGNVSFSCQGGTTYI